MMSRETCLEYDPAHCEICDRFARFGATQVYGFLWSNGVYENPGPYYFDVALARRIAQRGHAIHFFNRKEVGASLAQTEIWPEHLRHVNPNAIPVIGKVPLTMRKEYSRLDDPRDVTTGMPFIDGKHAAARRIAEGATEIPCYVLSEAETFRTIIPNLTDWAIKNNRLDMVRHLFLKEAGKEEG